jgi:hypothetical protein
VDGEWPKVIMSSTCLLSPTSVFLLPAHRRHSEVRSSISLDYSIASCSCIVADALIDIPVLYHTAPWTMDLKTSHEKKKECKLRIN